MEPPMMAEENPPMPKKTACPREPCPEFAKKFQLEAYIAKIVIKVRTVRKKLSVNNIGSNIRIAKKATSNRKDLERSNVLSDSLSCIVSLLSPRIFH